MWYTILAWVSAAVVILVFVILAVGLIKISGVLRAIGGSDGCAIADLNRALAGIDKEATPLTSDAVKLNNTLRKTRDGLSAIDGRLTQAAASMQRQEG